MSSTVEGVTRVRGRRVFVAAAALAACGSVAACKDNTSPSTPAASVVQASAPDTLVGVVGAVLDTQLTVRIMDASGRPVANTIVAFAVSGPGPATVDPANPTTDDSGTVRSTVTLGTVPGLDTVTATVVSAAPPPPATFYLLATAGPPAQIAPAGGNLQSAPAGTVLPDSLVAQVTDQYGNPLAGVTVQWSSGGVGTLGATTSQTDANGLAATTFTLGATPGTQTVTAAVSPSISVNFLETAQ